MNVTHIEKKIDIMLENSNGGVLMVETAVVFSGQDESDAIRDMLARMFAEGMTVLPGDTIRFVER